MLSEVDLRDWDKVDFKRINEVMEDGTFLDERGVIWEFISQVEEVYKSQIRVANMRVPAILRKGEE